MTGANPNSFAGYTRAELRKGFAEAWRKERSRSPLTPLEGMIAAVIALHPEYQVLIEDTEAAVAFESNPSSPAQNPFLHMGLHLAVREQLSIDRPPGIVQLARALESRLGDVHRAEHVLMEALAETLWESQRSGQAPDEEHYLMLARRRL